MKKYLTFWGVFLLIFPLFLSQSWGESGGTYVNGDILDDTVWLKSESPYIIDTSFSIKEGTTLTVQAGVEVKIAKSIAIILYGELDLQGSAFAPIVFSSSYTAEVVDLYLANKEDLNISYCDFSDLKSFNIETRDDFRNIDIDNTKAGNLSLVVSNEHTSLDLRDNDFASLSYQDRRVTSECAKSFRIENNQVNSLVIKAYDYEDIQFIDNKILGEEL